MFAGASASSGDAAPKNKHPGTGICGRMLGTGPITTMRASALFGFANFSDDGLLTLAREFGVPTGEDSFETCLALLRKFAPGLEDQEYCDIIDSRGVPKHAVEELLTSEECLDALGPDDAKLLANYNSDREKILKKSFWSKLEGFKAQVASNMCTKKNLKPGSPCEKKLVSKGTRLYPSVASASRLSEEDALAFLPPGSLVTKSVLDNRWRIRWASFSISRAWTLYGELEAFGICAIYLWDVFAKNGGFECPFEWITKQRDV